MQKPLCIDPFLMVGSRSGGRGGGGDDVFNVSILALVCLLKDNQDRHVLGVILKQSRF